MVYYLSMSKHEIILQWWDIDKNIDILFESLKITQVCAMQYFNTKTILYANS